jgi:FMN phosphatase YigB (HAD superfamily)
MTSEKQVVFLFDVDDTLLDNDTAQDDYLDHITKNFGAQAAQRYWAIFQQLFQELGYADYLGALQRYRLENLHDPRLFMMSCFLLDYPFEERLYPRALEVLKHLQRFGLTVILSDGDVVFQPRKVQRSGIRDAVAGHVLIYVHKEIELSDVERFYPADRYVLVDDKPRILTAVKQIWGGRVITVQPRQGHYANDPKAQAAYPPADLTIDRIGDLLNYDMSALLALKSSA